MTVKGSVAVAIHKVESLKSNIGGMPVGEILERLESVSRCLDVVYFEMVTKDEPEPSYFKATNNSGGA